MRQDTKLDYKIKPPGHMVIRDNTKCPQSKFRQILQRQTENKKTCKIKINNKISPPFPSGLVSVA